MHAHPAARSLPHAGGRSRRADTPLARALVSGKGDHALFIIDLRPAHAPIEGTSFKLLLRAMKSILLPLHREGIQHAMQKPTCLSGW
jgi:hypothetical protein